MPDFEGKPSKGDPVRLLDRDGAVRQYMRRRADGCYVVELQEPRAKEFATVLPNFVDGTWKEQFSLPQQPATAADEGILPGVYPPWQAVPAPRRLRSPWIYFWAGMVTGTVVFWLFIWLSR
jgi:hypothetical protein